jgi:hypothetical protein
VCKHDLDSRLSLPMILKTGLILTFVKTGDLLLMSSMKISHIFRSLSSTRLSQFNTDTDKCVPDGFQGCSQMNTSRRNERHSYRVVKWTGSCPGPRLLYDFCNRFIFYYEGLSAPRPTPIHPLSFVRGCLFNIFTATLYSWRLFLHLQPEDTPCCGDRDPPNMVIIHYKVLILKYKS